MAGLTLELRAEEFGQKLTARTSVPDNYTINKSKDASVVCLSVMFARSDSNLPQDKALGTFARNRHSCHRSTHVDRIVHDF